MVRDGSNKTTALVSIISIIVSIAAIGFSYWTYSDTRQVVKEFEKPILNLDEPKINEWRC